MMKRLSVGATALRVYLNTYLQQVKIGSTLVITERGTPIGRIVPVKPSVEERMEKLRQSGLVAWSDRKLAPIDPVAKTRGERAVAELLLEDRE